MNADRWSDAVRRQLSLGRLLPLGEAPDGAWLTEAAARGHLRDAGAALEGIEVRSLRVGPVPGADTSEPAVPPPPSALRPGPLAVTGEFAARGDRPLTDAARDLRAALHRVAREELGLEVTEVDLRVTELLTDTPPDDADAPHEGGERKGTAGSGTTRAPTGEEGGLSGSHADEGSGSGASDEVGVVSRAARKAPGVARLTGALGGHGRAVHVGTADEGFPGAGGRQARVELAVSRGHRPVDVARSVRRAVTEALAPDEAQVAVVVTELE